MIIAIASYPSQIKQEVLRFERELLQLEQEELRRQRENLLRDQNRIIQKSVQDVSVLVKPPHRPKNNSHRHSMPNLALNENYVMPKVSKLTPSSGAHVSKMEIERNF